MSEKTENAYAPIPPREGSDAKTFWKHVGNVYLNRDGSKTLVLDCIPFDREGRIITRIVLREPREEERTEAA